MINHHATFERNLKILTTSVQTFKFVFVFQINKTTFLQIKTANILKDNGIFVFWKSSPQNQLISKTY